MKIHEYQAKEVLARFGVPIPRNAGVAFKPEEVREKVAQLGGKGVLKAQVHTGGRGKAGGIRIASSPEEAERLAQQMLGMLLKTHQAPAGLKVEKLLIEEPISIQQEIYAGVVPDRVSRCNVLIVSARGGMDIETVAAEEPEAVVRLPIDPLEGPHDFEIRQACYKAGLDPVLVNRLVGPLRGLLNAFVGVDASLAEINPLAVTEDGRVLAADAKIEIDDSALFRHPDLAAFAEESEEDPLEAQAHRLDIAYVRLKGEVGIICNGAGLTMATMDAVQRAGGRPANFLDVGGGAQSERVKTCLGIVLSDPQVRGVLINIFGGITRCDEVAKGIVMAKNSLEVKVPLVVRLAGTRAEEGAAILAQEGITPAATMPEAAEKIVALTR
ncbi:succinyl-CoA synthetase (ADP-forming) beta subunit [Chthonomonas calidirosea]|uniref:Succinate--CoA ligase [ADP-forming] subunit beta n=1 Tax=Chthonomonas calidirosea (strain DSM 23976 / ICMP 18418 / T49) TaxID=1303518 RepID=S0EVR5_CHTCT|nr:ADP-forming succinate--CoA ligase subunit beta [Chthonomonas calidirosea]CCW34477.1 succinyl-CoA synthetase (ADP-forming) beta subunit [Chthonomonas calidirosea T49]CEK14671.1 succinyl-CoA synthetase (ADP-forming) beta subunit [Chthonomonas calidirosea]